MIILEYCQLVFTFSIWDLFETDIIEQPIHYMKCLASWSTFRKQPELNITNPNLKISIYNKLVKSYYFMVGPYRRVEVSLPNFRLVTMVTFHFYLQEVVYLLFANTKIINSKIINLKLKKFHIFLKLWFLIY